MPKYYYKPIKDVVKSTYLENTGVDMFANDDYDLNIEVVVEAADEAESEKIRIGLTDIRMWELDRTED